MKLVLERQYTYNETFHTIYRTSFSNDHHTENSLYKCLFSHFYLLLHIGTQNIYDLMRRETVLRTGVSCQLHVQCSHEKLTNSFSHLVCLVRKALLAPASMFLCSLIQFTLCNILWLKSHSGLYFLGFGPLIPIMFMSPEFLSSVVFVYAHLLFSLSYCWLRVLEIPCVCPELFFQSLHPQ